MLRQYIAMTVGALCLIVAAAVSAEEGAAPPVDPANIERQVDQARAYVDRLQKMLSAGFAELEDARKSQNISRVNCVNEALTTMKGLVKLAESNLMARHECSSRKDAACTEHEYVKISIAFNKAEELEGQLKGCGGPSIDSAIDGRPMIEKQIENVPDIDPTAGLTDLAPRLENPPSASPFYVHD
jgi:hypothetical protein